MISLQEAKIGSNGNYILKEKNLYKVIVKSYINRHYKLNDCFYVLCIGPDKKYNDAFNCTGYYKMIHSRFGIITSGYGEKSLADSKYFQYFQLI